VSTRRRILADRDALQRLLENLFRNAVQHAGPDATVVVGDIDRPAQDPGQETTGFYVEDDGSGIPLEERDSVFDPWTSSGDDVMGFGLTIVARAAAAHGWDVLATDGISGGARIEVTGVGTAGT
jgi:signal transduction histidine kinase